MTLSVALQVGGWDDVPWSAVITVIVLMWAVGSLALIERLRRTFVTPNEQKAMEDRLCSLIHSLEERIDRFEADLKKWERELDGNVAKRAELNGFGARVGNLEHMFTATQKIAEEARQQSRDALMEIRHLTEKVGEAVGKVQDAATKTDRMMNEMTELRTELRIYFKGKGSI